MGLVAVVGLAAAALLAVVGLPYGKGNPEAFAHVYVHPSGLNGHLIIDAQSDCPLTPLSTDPSCWCNPIDSTATVTLGSTNLVGICMDEWTADGNSGLIESLELDITNNAALNFAPDPQGSEEAVPPGNCGPSDTDCVNDNPNFNDGTGVDNVGSGWSCTGFGLAPPRSQVLPIHLVCAAPIGGTGQLTADPALLATITFNAVGTGVDTLSFADPTDIGFADPGLDYSCFIGGGNIGCFGATIDKVPDLGITKVAVPATAIAGSDELFNFELTNNGAAAAPVLVFDDLDNSVVFDPLTSDPSCALIIPPGPPAAEPDGTNVVQCGPFMALPGGNVVDPGIEVSVPLDLAGKTIDNAAMIVPGDPNASNDASVISVPVAPASITVTKVLDKAVYSEGESITATITATSNGPSPASSVVLTDTVDANQSITSASIDGPETCTETGTQDAQIVGQTVTCTLSAPLAASDDVVLTVVSDVIASAGNACTDAAEVCWADPLCSTPSPPTTSATCLPPTVRMEKDIDTDATSIVNATNLFIQKDVSGHLLPLTIYELVSNPGDDPTGVGAYEFELKYDHNIFQQPVITDTGWLSNGGARSVDCSWSIINENAIWWGCVSSGPPGSGQTVAGVAAIITLTPQPDLVLRLTPGQQNGVFSPLLDENCELANPLGDPLNIGEDPVTHRLILAPGILPGGQVAVCSDMGITVRILEGDLNLDCAVNVLDEQAIAFRYGATFGNLLYDSWYDLEPALKDYDIDIKDLQKVWGRQGSTCASPIPAQDPVPLPDPQ
jgi:uncharacterized repeat protein (TIGR01451 family)